THFMLKLAVHRKLCTHQTQSSILMVVFPQLHTERLTLRTYRQPLDMSCQRHSLHGSNRVPWSNKPRRLATPATKRPHNRNGARLRRQDGLRLRQRSRQTAATVVHCCPLLDQAAE